MCIPSKDKVAKCPSPPKKEDTPSVKENAAAVPLTSRSPDGHSKRQSGNSKNGSRRNEPSGKSIKSTKSFRVARTNSEAVKKGQEWIQRVLDVGVAKSVEEFRQLARWKPENMTTEAAAANPEKNRYKDVPCQDEKRVILKFPGLASDYIHANYVATPKSEKRFICTQGPLEDTQLAFWAMILQEQAEAILMLCNTLECGKIKCHQYWPEREGDSLSFGEGEGEVTVTNKGTVPLSDKEKTIRVTQLTIRWKEEERTVTHYQWENWPDRGVPPSAQTAISLIAAVRHLQTPIVVHCSAGIGRTGTIVAIAYVQERMQNGECCMAMNELLKNIRSQRPSSIQNEMQYIYLHRVLLTYLLERHKERYGRLLADPEMKAKYEQWCADYDKATA